MIEQTLVDITQKINAMDLDIQAITDGRVVHLLKKNGRAHMFGTNLPPWCFKADGLLSNVPGQIVHATFITELTHHMQVVTYLAKIGAPI